jgi:predicted transporter
MEIKSLLLGIIFSIGIFAVKCGVGLHYRISRMRPGQRRWPVPAAFAGIYLLVFLIVELALIRMDLTAHLDRLLAFVKTGMLIHLVMAALLIVWGLHLLRARPAVDADPSRGWLLLVLPCPVCATVIFLSLAFLAAGFPGCSLQAAAGLYAGFLLISLVTMGAMAIGGRAQTARPETRLGAAMLLIAVYFLLSVTVIPQFAEVDKIYRLSLAATSRTAWKWGQVVVFSLFIGAVFVAGAALKTVIIRRKP